MPGRFLDSNVLLYLASNDSLKADIASDLLSGGATISVQVLNEIASVFLGKWRRPWPETEDFLTLIRGLAEVRPLLETTHTLGLSLARRHHFSLYDAMIVAAALEAECDTLLSEDMQHSMRIEDRLTILNPFRTKI